jgi:hypothetical protein
VSHKVYGEIGVFRDRETMGIKMGYLSVTSSFTAYFREQHLSIIIKEAERRKGKNCSSYPSGR